MHFNDLAICVQWMSMILVRLHCFPMILLYFFDGVQFSNSCSMLFNDFAILFNTVQLFRDRSLQHFCNWLRYFAMILNAIQWICYGFSMVFNEFAMLFQGFALVLKCLFDGFQRFGYVFQCLLTILQSSVPFVFSVRLFRSSFPFVCSARLCQSQISTNKLIYVLRTWLERNMCK